MTAPPPRPTGRRDDRDRDWIVFTRRFRAPIDDVWAAATTRTAWHGQTWRMRLDLAEADGTATLVFGQQLTDPDIAASVGPGWDYYLDRLVAAEAGQDVASIDFDRYYPALSDHYRSLFD